jgi:coenzyme F420-reducing hydrogenase beta subunit
MTGSAPFPSHPGIRCSICAALVPLEISMTDEHGEAVHEECYVHTTISRFRASAVPPRANFGSSLMRLQLGFPAGRTLSELKERLT